MIDWLVTNALGALALAAIAGVLIWTFRPAPAVRHALWLVVLLKLVLPTGPTVSLPVEGPPPVEPRMVTAEVAPEDPLVAYEEFTVVVKPKPGQTADEAAALALRPARDADEATDARPGPAVTPVPQSEALPAPPFDYRPLMLGAWLAGAVLVGWRQLRDTVRFARFAGQARPAPDYLVAEVAAVADRLGVRVPAVRVLAGLTSPVMWCLGRPVLLWPAGLECRLKGDGRRAVIAHELAHLRRRDHWVRRVEMVAAVLHWWNPLFWVARRKLRADAELACDAWAAGQADRRAYAEALLEVCSFNPRRRPAPAVGVFGEGRRAMQERLTMIMRDRVPCRLAFGAKLVVALMAVAAVPAWTLGQQGKPEAVSGDVYLVEVVAEEADDEATKEIEAQIRALAQKLEALKAGKQAEAQKKAAEKLKEAQGKLGEKLMELKLRVGDKDVEVHAPKLTTGGTRVLVAGQDGIKVIGPDGKEIKGAQVIIGGQGGTAPAARPYVIEGTSGDNKKMEFRIVGPDGKPATVQGGQFKFVGPDASKAKPGTPSAVTAPAAPMTTERIRAIYSGASGSGGQSITLSRATYKLGKDQATALGTLLGSIKATVMETKVDGDNVTVTTTPEVQQAIGQIVRLIQGQGGTTRYEFRTVPGQGNLFTPTAPAKPAVPATPATPVKPAPAARPSSVKPTAVAQPVQVDVKTIIEKAVKGAETPVQVDVKAVIEKALKESGADRESIEAKRLEEILKSLKAREVEKAKSQGKPNKPSSGSKPEKDEE